MTAPPVFEPRVALFSLPRWVILLFAGALLLNSFATALLATSLVLHIAGRLWPS